MDKAAEVSQPRVIAQTKDFHENEYRLVWRPPTPADHPDGDGEPTQGHLIIEQRGEDALGEPAWRGSRVDPLAECDHGGLYALIVKLHTAYETAWDQRESIAARMHDMFNTLVRDEERFAEVMRQIEHLTNRLAARADPTPAPEAAPEPPARGIYADEPQNNAIDLRSRLGYTSTLVRGAAAEVTRPDLRQTLIAVANEIEKAIAHPFLVDPKPAPIVAVPDSFPTIDIEAVGAAASEIQSAYESLAFAPPEGYRIHIVRMCDAIQELANALGLKPPSEVSPPVAIMIAAARAFVHGGSFDDDDIEATDLVAAVKAYEAQT